MNIHSKEVGLSYRLGVVRGAVREEKRMPPKKRSRKEAELEEEYESYTNDQLREALQQAGKNPGPIDAANRSVINLQSVLAIISFVHRKLYVNQLVKTQTVTETSPSPVVLASPEKTYKKSKSELYSLNPKCEGTHSEGVARLCHAVNVDDLPP